MALSMENMMMNVWVLVSPSFRKKLQKWKKFRVLRRRCPQVSAVFCPFLYANLNSNWDGWGFMISPCITGTYHETRLETLQLRARCVLRHPRSRGPRAQQGVARQPRRLGWGEVFLEIPKINGIFQWEIHSKIWEKYGKHLGKIWEKSYKWRFLAVENHRTVDSPWHSMATFDDLCSVWMAISASNQ